MIFPNLLMKTTHTLFHLEQVVINQILSKKFYQNKLLAEMYMYKRNAQQQSISEFIKDSSIQEEETDCKEIDKALLQKDEDFMFQMDKGMEKCLK